VKEPLKFVLAAMDFLPERTPPAVQTGNKDQFITGL
jgi:hypothetical protein